jgi:hypothetical protein
MYQLFYSITLQREKDNKKNVINLIEAHASIAKSYMALGKIDEALKHMGDYLETSKQNRKQNYSVNYRKFN